MTSLLLGSRSCSVLRNLRSDAACLTNQHLGLIVLSITTPAGGAGGAGGPLKAQLATHDLFQSRLNLQSVFVCVRVAQLLYDWERVFLGENRRAFYLCARKQEA